MAPKIEDVSNLERGLGRVEARIDNVESDIGEIKGDVRLLVGAMQQAKGGWRVVAAIGATSGVVGGALVKLGLIIGWH